MGNVNLKVDNDIQLVPILAVQSEWEQQHKIRALAISRSGALRSRALKDLEDLQQKHPEDFSKLMFSMSLVGQELRVDNPNHVKRGKKYKSIYEMRGGHARLFFFYTQNNEEVVVCTHAYWKTKPSKEEQNEAFATADNLRKQYEAYCEK